MLCCVVLVLGAVEKGRVEDGVDAHEIICSTIQTYHTVQQKLCVVLCCVVLLLGAVEWKMEWMQQGQGEYTSSVSHNNVGTAQIWMLSVMSAEFIGLM